MINDQDDLGGWLQKNCSRTNSKDDYRLLVLKTGMMALTWMKEV